jgi:hypothetical protein
MDALADTEQGRRSSQGNRRQSCFRPSSYQDIQWQGCWYPSRCRYHRQSVAAQAGTKPASGRAITGTGKVLLAATAAYDEEIAASADAKTAKKQSGKGAAPYLQPFKTQ